MVHVSKTIEQPMVNQISDMPEGNGDRRTIRGGKHLVDGT